MRERILAGFGGPLERVERALAAIAAGRGVLVTDDERRENEGDIIFAAESITEAQMAMLIREGSGIVCLCLTPEKVRGSACRRGRVDPSRFGTAFTVTIEAAEGVTTGVFAHDRVATIKAAVADSAVPEHLHRPRPCLPTEGAGGRCP